MTGFDVQTYLNGPGDDRRIASGICIGPLREVVTDSGRRIGNILATCALMAFDPGAESDQAVPFAGVQLWELGGISLSVAADPFNGDYFWGMGVSVLKLAESLNSGD